ncbi:hypothetical protein [Antribacter gilvus]|uniref:hypothetical protein n=1 Tax=Antribacter gilvus TaxID=2304675 RepID=UPI000F7BAF19|nr:hypothetical protein [Antribacter gilvus]
MDDPGVRALRQAGATWDDDAEAGAWLRDRLTELNASVSGAVPDGYEAYAVVPLSPQLVDGDEEYAPHAWLDALLDVLAPVTGDQPVHCGTWEGWGAFYDVGEDPGTAPGMGIMFAGDEDATPEEIERVTAEGRAHLARVRPQRPDAGPLALPDRRYYLWTGPLRSVGALNELLSDPPTLVWPEDRSWFLGVPIYTLEAALGGPKGLVDAVLADPRLGARRADRSTELDIDD